MVDPTTNSMPKCGDRPSWRIDPEESRVREQAKRGNRHQRAVGDHVGQKSRGVAAQGKQQEGAAHRQHRLAPLDEPGMPAADGSR